MGKTIEFHPLARKEVAKAHRWYRKISPSAANGLRTEIDYGLGVIAEQPDRWEDYLHGTKRYLVDRYPYVIVYVERKDCVYVIAVAHGRRRPGYWKRRLNL